jgi:tripartite-type tricarboxylate transporter receptor subunit TctC
MNIHRSLLSAFVGIVALACGTAWSQNYPTRPVRVIIVFAPGGGTDIVGRIVSQKVGEQLGQQFVVENRAGAAGMIGAEIVMKSPPDGYTLMIYTQTMLVNAHLYKKTPYDALTSFVGITPRTRLVSMFAVHPSMPVRNVREFIALEKSRPNEIAYGSSGVGGVQHLATSSFASMAGIKLNHVPFKGGAPAVVALMGGEIQAIITPIAEILPHMKSGRMRIIAVSSKDRVKQFPDIPAIGETLKGYEYSSWFGAFAPAGTPRPIVDKLNAEIRKAMQDPAVLANLSAQTLDPMPMSPEEFAKFLKADYDKLRKVVADSGAKVE